jgi:hypothetical protein
MDEKDIQQSFNDYIEPARIPFSYQSPGWYMLATLLLIALALLVFFIIRQYRKNRYRSQALRFLSVLQQQYGASDSYQLLAYQTAILIKRIAIAKYGRTAVAGLCGNPWIHWLNATIKKKTKNKFGDTDLRLVGDGIYADQKLTAEQVNPFVEKAKTWIRYHHAI